MKKYNINNKGSRIGTIRANIDALRRIPLRYKLVGASFILGAGILVSILSQETKADDKLTNTSKDKAMHESIVDTSLFRADLFAIPGDNQILFVTADYLAEHDYVPLDNIDSRYEFIIEANDEIMAKKDELDPEKLAAYEEQYQGFRMRYEEYIDGRQQSSLMAQEFILQEEERTINLIHGLLHRSYIPNAISYDLYLDELINVERKYALDIDVEKDTTLSEIISSYADNEDEYRRTFDEVVEINNIENPDLIYAGDTIRITNVDGLDLENMGYTLFSTPRQELDERIIWINQEMETIMTLSGDFNSESLLNTTNEIVHNLNIEYNEFISEAAADEVTGRLIYESRQACDNISLLTGHEFAPMAKKVR